MNTTQRSKFLTFSGADFGWSYLLMVLVAIVTPLLAVILPAADWARGGSLVTSLLLPEGMELTEAFDGARLWGDRVMMEMESPSSTARLVHLGRGLLLTLVVWWVLYLMGRLMRSVQEGSPFQPANVSRLRIAGLVTMGAAVGGVLLNGIVNPLLLREVLPIQDVLWLSHLDYTSLMVVGFGVVLTMVSEVFRRGVRLEEDAEGVI